jgi:hypothetical protein
MLTPFVEPFVPFGFATANPNPPSANSVYLFRARLARYRVAADPTDGLPSLWRSESGRYMPGGGAATPDPGTAGFDPAATPWQLVARGIEDLQMQYRDSTGAWLNSPPVSVQPPAPTPYDALVRQVRVTLSARTSATGIQGESTGGGGAPRALRGQLSAVITPRPTAMEMQNCTSNATPCQATEQIR